MNFAARTTLGLLVLASTFACGSGSGSSDTDSNGLGGAGTGGAQNGTGGASPTGGQANPGSGGDTPVVLGPPPDFGDNVLIFDPTMSMDDIQAKLNDVFGQQEENQFGGERVAIFFKPGDYSLDVQIGFYMQALGLGKSPDDVHITGAVRSKATWFDGNATQNFWRAVENLSVTPTQDGGKDVWAISQATALRRVHVRGPLALSDNGWSSGGFIADSQIDDHIESGTQQQFFTRNTVMTEWQGGSWNMVFVGTDNPPAGTWPGQPYTVIDKAPVLREKPYLTIDDDWHYFVMLPPLKKDSRLNSWSNGSDGSTAISTDAFYVAHSDSDTAASMNAALASGKHLLLTPGVYHLEQSLQVDKPGTIVFGIGYATLEPDNGTPALNIADVDGVTVAGILFDAGEQNSDTLLQMGPSGSAASHAAAPSALFDVFCRVGGAGNGRTTTCLSVASNDVITDNLWLWRADHGDGVDWYNGNPSKHGLIVDGDDVTMYGLFVEHFLEYQTMWNGNGGRVYFYQSELPYDVPNQGAWTHDGINGYATYKVADGVTTHEAWGLGAYCVFYNNVKEENAFSTPSLENVKMHHLFTEWLGVNTGSEITHIINGFGNKATSSNRQQRTDF